MNVGRRGLRLAVGAGAAVGVAVILAFALSGALWPAGGPARAVAGQCGTGDNLVPWDATVTLLPDSGPAGTSLTVGVAGIALNIVA